MSLLRLAISGEFGSFDLNSSLVLILLAVAVGISGIMSLILPPGIVLLAALLITFLRAFSAWCILMIGSPVVGSVDVGSGSFRTSCSVILVNFSQSALLKLIKFLKSLFVWLIDVLIFIMIGR